MDYSLSERFRSLMEDCRVMATGQFLVLVPNDSPEHLISNIRTALVASTLRLQSLDHIKKRYVRSELEDSIEVDPNLKLYQKCYFASKRHIESTIRKLRTENRREPTLGEFGASIVLERLPTSFFFVPYPVPNWSKIRRTRRIKDDLGTDCVGLCCLGVR